MACFSFYACPTKFIYRVLYYIWLVLVSIPVQLNFIYKVLYYIWLVLVSIPVQLNLYIGFFTIYGLF